MSVAISTLVLQKDKTILRCTGWEPRVQQFDNQNATQNAVTSSPYFTLNW